MASNTLRAGLGFDAYVGGTIRFKGEQTRMNATPASGPTLTQDEKDTLLQMTNETLTARDRQLQREDEKKTALARKKALILKKKQARQGGQSIPISSTLESQAKVGGAQLQSQQQPQPQQPRPRHSRWHDPGNQTADRQLALSFLNNIETQR